MDLFKNFFKNLMDWFQGRHTFFAVFFALTGFFLACAGKLTGQYVALITALQAFVLTHSIKESHFKEGDSNGGSSTNDG